MDMAITKISSKGQVVIPADMRKDLKEGDKLLIIKTKEQIILKRIDLVEPKLKEDLEFAKRTEKAWEEYDMGKFTESTKEGFLKELEKW